MKKLLPIIILIIVVIAGVALVRAAVNNDSIGDGAGAENDTYTNSLYDYSLTYPDTYSLKEYTQERISIGMPGEGDAFNSAADIAVFESEPGNTYTGFENFAATQAANQCAADGPNESISCSASVDYQPFESDNGVSGITFTLNKTHRMLNGSTTTNESFGPIYAFDISPTPGQFRALVIHPPVALAASSTDPDLITSIAESVVLESDSSSATSSATATSTE